MSVIFPFRIEIDLQFGVAYKQRCQVATSFPNKADVVPAPLGDVETRTANIYLSNELPEATTVDSASALVFNNVFDRFKSPARAARVSSTYCFPIFNFETVGGISMLATSFAPRHRCINSREDFMTNLSVKIAVAMLLLSSPGTSALAQQSTTPPLAAMPVPSELDLAKMIWSTLAALDHANQSGNYSVLRDLSAPGFQSANNPSQLSNIFSALRESRLDLSNALLLAPTYSAAPAVSSDNILDVRGFFGLRPTAVSFQLQYQWVGGRWRLFGVAINPATMAQSMPGPASPSVVPAKPDKDKKR